MSTPQSNLEGARRLIRAARQSPEDAPGPSDIANAPSGGRSGAARRAAGRDSWRARHSNAPNPSLVRHASPPRPPGGLPRHWPCIGNNPALTPRLLRFPCLAKPAPDGRSWRAVPAANSGVARASAPFRKDVAHDPCVPTCPGRPLPVCRPLARVGARVARRGCGATGDDPRRLFPRPLARDHLGPPRGALH